MKISHSTTMLVMVLSLLSGCETADTKEQAAATVDSAAVTQMISDAKTSYEEVHAMGNAWRDTEDMIKAAEEASQKGDLAAAEKLARTASEQNQLAKAQAEAEKNAGPLY